MSNSEFAVKYLTAIEKTHKDYFEKTNIKLIDCVEIIGGKTATVHIINQDLPPEIKYEIETMFWVN